jgi:hypothetical protein
VLRRSRQLAPTNHPFAEREPTARIRFDNLHERFDNVQAEQRRRLENQTREEDRDAREMGQSAWLKTRSIYVTDGEEESQCTRRTVPSLRGRLYKVIIIFFGFASYFIG